MTRKYSDEQIKAMILHKLKRRTIWGGKYKPHTQVVNWIEGRIQKNGKRTKRLIDELVKARYLLTNKGGNVVSLNPREGLLIAKHTKKHLE